MKRQFKVALFSGVALAAVAATAPVAAQETSSSLRGSVVTQAGDQLSGVSVTITHVPSGTTREFTTNSDGVFYARGLKVGGPYIVQLADGSSYTANSINDLFLTLGQPSTVRLVAGAAGTALDEITVTGQRISSSIRTGAGTDWNADALAAMNSTNRDIKSVLRTDPKIWIDPANDDALSIGGNNNRFNSLTVDGVQQNDDFGLNDNGYPTQRSPISLDAIEQISVNIAPFDVTYGGFQGGNINIVTKSGTNEFHGSVFYEYSDSGLVGDKSGNGDDDPSNDGIDIAEFEEKTFGGTLGGPIVKDKLFFFFGYEKFDSTRPFISRTSVPQAELDRVTQIARDVYGFDTMGFNAASLQEKDEKIIAKLDWNINDFHRLSATYQRTTGNAINPQGTFSGDAGSISHWYNKDEKIETYSFQLFSDWSDSFSTELKVGLKDQVTGQTPFGGNDFALMTIGSSTGDNIRLGPDFFRHANALSNDNLVIKAKADYSTGDHLFSFGFEMTDQDVFNLFVPGSAGEYTFTDVDAFEAQAPTSLFYQNAFTNDANDASATFGFKTHTAYLQDRWTPTDNLTLYAGVRFERFSSNDEPRENQSFITRNGFTNTENLHGKSIFLPRFGFNYVFDDRTVIRGGAGLFSGTGPKVWISNSFSNDGQIIDSVFIGDDAILAGANGRELPVEATSALEAGDGNVNAIDPNLNLFSKWKFNIAVEREFDLSWAGLGDGWNVSLEAIFDEVKDAPVWTETRRTKVGTAPDGRPIYDVPGGYDLILGNTDEGSGQVYTVNFNKRWETDAGDFSLSAGYAHQNIKDVNSGQSSTATSNFGRISTSDRNNMLLATSNHQIKHRYTANFNWQKDFWGDNTTSVNLFFQSRSGRHFSYTFDDPGQRTGSSDTLEEVLADGNTVFGGDRSFWRRDTQLLYVPTGTDDPNIDWANSDIDAAAFNTWISQAGLDAYRGGIAPRNSASSPWTTQIDLRFTQEVPVWEGHKIKLYVDVDNLTNLLDSDWGRIEQVPFHFNNNVVRAALNADGSQYVLSRFDPDENLDLLELPSLWKVQFGIQYSF